MQVRRLTATSQESRSQARSLAALRSHSTSSISGQSMAAHTGLPALLTASAQIMARLFAWTMKATLKVPAGQPELKSVELSELASARSSAQSPEAAREQPLAQSSARAQAQVLSMYRVKRT